MGLAPRDAQSMVVYAGCTRRTSRPRLRPISIRAAFVAPIAESAALRAMVVFARNFGRKSSTAPAGVGLEEVRDAFGTSGQQGQCVVQHQGVVVRADDPRRGGQALEDLVRVGFGGDARADVEELVDALSGEPGVGRRMNRRFCRAVSRASGGGFPPTASSAG